MVGDEHWNLVQSAHLPRTADERYADRTRYRCRLRREPMVMMMQPAEHRDRYDAAINPLGLISV